MRFWGVEHLLWSSLTFLKDTIQFRFANADSHADSRTNCKLGSTTDLQTYFERDLPTHLDGRTGIRTYGHTGSLKEGLGNILTDRLVDKRTHAHAPTLKIHADS